VHTFNRIFVLVMLSLLLVLGAFVLIAPAAWLSLMRSIADWFRGTVFVAYSDTGRVLARVLMAVVWAALIGSLIWLELRQGSSRDIEIVHHAGESTIRISTEDVRERVKSQVDAIPGVLGSKVHVIGRDRAVELKLGCDGDEGLGPGGQSRGGGAGRAPGGPGSARVAAGGQAAGVNPGQGRQLPDCARPRPTSSDARRRAYALAGAIIRRSTRSLNRATHCRRRTPCVSPRWTIRPC
jgi:hypothetical protein